MSNQQQQIPAAALNRWPSIFNTSVPINVDEFDDCVACLNSNAFDLADGTLRHFSDIDNQPDNFFRVDAILKCSNSPQAQHIALGLLNNAILRRWHSLTRDQQIAIRNFLSAFVMSVGTNSVAIQHHRYLVVKAASTLVSVAKFEWPDRWPTFVTEVLGSADASDDNNDGGNNQALLNNKTENALLILKILMEEVFVFGEKTMTSRWVLRKKRALSSDMSCIFDLCFRIMSSSGTPVHIVGRCLETLTVLFPCIDPKVTMMDQRFEVLVSRMLTAALNEPHLRVDAVKCLNEFACLSTSSSFANDGDDEKTMSSNASSVNGSNFGDFSEYYCSSSNSHGSPSPSSSSTTSTSTADMRRQQQKVNAHYSSSINVGLNCETLINVLSTCNFILNEYDNHGNALKIRTSNNNNHQRGNNNRNNHQQNDDNDEAVDLETRLMTAMENNSHHDLFFQNVAVYATTVITNYLPALVKNAHDNPSTKSALSWVSHLFIALAYSGSKESLKIAVEFWWHLGDLLVKKKSAIARDFIQDELQDIRLALIRNMAKPEEVTIFEDEDGELQYQQLSDVESVELYDKMRQTLVFFTHVDPEGMQSNIMELMRRILQGTDTWSWSSLNSLCWSFGAMSGALRQDEEKSFFIEYVRGLLKMCEGTRGKDNRAVIASGVMYVLSQYPQFLRAHPKFMKIVLKKLNEFFGEPFPGVKEMAVDTMLKIMSACAGNLWTAFEPVNQKPGAPLVPLAISLVEAAEDNCSELNYQERYTFYEAMGFLCATAQTREDAAKGVSVLLARANETINNAAGSVNNNPELILNYLSDQVENHHNNNNNNSNNHSGGGGGSGYDDLRSLLHCLRICARVAKTCGPCFMPEMSQIVFPCMTTMMPLFAQRIAAVVSQRGPNFIQGHQGMRVLKQLKREFLKITEHFVAATDDATYLAREIFPLVFGFILNDYKTGHPSTREPGVLALVAAVIKRSGADLNEYIPNILDCLFGPTVEIIADKPEDFPEHRINFFRTIDSMCQHCFGPFLEQVRGQPQIMDGIFWALKHHEPATSKVGCETLCSLLNKIGDDPMCWMFCQHYLARIIDETFSIVVDGIHQQGFKEQCGVLQRLFALVSLNLNNTTANDSSSSSSENNNNTPSQLAQSILSNLDAKLAQMEGMSNSQTRRFLNLCLSRCEPVDTRDNNCGASEEFCEVLADFLIEVKVWNADTENNFLNEKERLELECQVEGMQRPPADMSYLMNNSNNNNNDD